ncbi:MAG: sulfurtransferase [Anaerolineales bacterium]|nr:sulfurtransferase [Anaerolineales bacterium]
MTYTTLISTAELAEHLDDPDWAIVDARFVLTAPERGEQNYQRSHIPGAVYAHLERDLSDPVIPGVTGRHPWLVAEAAAAFFSNIGVGPGVQVVAYDDAGGALAAVRVWWMLRWLGHQAFAILDGGWQAWEYAERPVRVGVERRAPRRFTPQARPDLLIGVEQVDQMRQDPAYRVFDARAAERYRGENETIDPVAGHIPGAYSAPYLDNLDAQGALRPAQELRAHYQDLLAGIPPQNVVFYCGSGVTSIHNVLAMEVAGLEGARIYPGSWSEWIAPRTRPVATLER